jgi:hypothetical protein
MMPRIRDIISQIELVPGCSPLAPLRARQILTALSGACALWLALAPLDIAQARAPVSTARWTLARYKLAAICS